MAKKIIIIGGGPGGYVAAIRAAQLGAQILVVERDELGGTCLNWGCVPTKTLLHAARIYKAAQNTRRYGVYSTVESFRFDKMIEKKDTVVRDNVAGIYSLFKRHDIAYVKGNGRLIDPNTVEIEQAGGKCIKRKADAVIVATGSDSFVPKFVRYDGDRVITTTEALDLEQVPKSIAIIGGSVSGSEFACLFGQLGSEVY
jgi:dihydrolipoamide dehydrogenase